MAAKRTTDETGLVLAPRGVPDEAAIREWAEELVARAGAEGVDLTGDGGLLTGLVRQVLQTGLEVELADHLGYEPYESAGRPPARVPSAATGPARTHGAGCSWRASRP
jgi:putative transposase